MPGRPPAALLRLALLLPLAACAAPRPLVLGATPEPAIPRPLVLVPGVTGSRLCDEATGEVAFGRGVTFLLPRDGGYRIAPRLDDGDGLEPCGVIREVRLAWVRKPVYQPVVDAAARLGYRLGDLERPRPEDTLYLFAYDWRRDNVSGARRLAEQLEGVRRVRGQDRLAVDLLCQSNGAHLCRWFAKYRDLDPEAAANGPGPATRLEVGKLILVGASNGGALRILREMNRGRRYVQWIGRAFRPEIFFPMRTLYEDLPHDDRDLFVDSQGRALEVDLYDAASWERYGWSIFDAQAARRVARRDTEGRFGTATQRSAFLREVLAATRRFQRLLAADGPAWGGATIYLLENGTSPTPRRALLQDDGDGRPRTLFADELAAGQAALRDRLLAPGDGHATLASQHRLADQELAALQPPRRIEGAHFESILEPDTLETLVQVLAEPLAVER